jgi:GTP-binding protein
MSRYIIAIVGRPNVGKSTLFNRMIGHREAIVHDQPGVTRDRNYADAEWGGKSFTLIDTGGYLPKSADVVERAMRDQATVAMEEADAVVFLVDGQEGVVPIDKDIASILRKSNKKTYLVVNKVDGDKHEANVGQFFALGLGEPISVSAEAGRRVGDFLDVLVHDIPRGVESKSDERLKLAIVGKPNVGKSSFVNALLGQERSIVTDIPGTTRDPVDSILRYHGEEVLLVDTAGLRRRSKTKESVEFYSTIRAIKSIERCDVAIVIIDAVQGMDKQDLRIIETISDRKRSFVLAVNKWDLVEKDSTTALSFERTITSMLRKHAYAPTVFISARTKQRLIKTLEVAKHVFDERCKRIPTNRLNTALLPEIRRKPPSSKTGREIKIKYITQAKANPPVFAFFVNDPTIINESYRRFLEALIRENFEFAGTPLTLSFRRKSR